MPVFPSGSLSRVLMLSALFAGVAAQGGCDEDGVSTFVPELRLGADAHDFGEVSVGASRIGEITVINDGNAPLELESAITTSDAMFTVEDAPGFPLPGGQFTTVTVSFTPTVEESVSGQLLLPFSSPLETATVQLRGVGIAPPITLSPGALDFGSIDAGQSATDVVTVTNQSEDALFVDLVITNSIFTMDGSIQTRVELEPGQSSAVDIAFAPPGAGAFSGTLIAEICGPQCGPQVALTGEGRAPRIEALPRPLDFGAVSVGETATLDLALSNTGVGALSISRMSLEDATGAATLGAGFDESALPIDILPDETVIVPVTYAPQTPEGDFQATLVIDSNDPLSPRVAVPIVATTPGAALRVVPGALHFGRLEPGEDRLLDVILLSSGTDVVEVDRLDIEGVGSAAFDVVGLLPSFPFAMPPGESLLLSVSATATEEDAANAGASAQLSLGSSAGDVDVAMTFTSGNTGCQPSLRPPNLSFGNLRVGQGARGRVEITNEGDGPCTLVRVAPAPGLAFDPGFVFQSLGLESLAPGESGSVQFAFQARTEGPATAILAVEFEEQPAPLMVSASARGVTGALVAVPPSVTIGPTIAGCVEGTTQFSLVNDGAGAVTITGISSDPASGPIEMLPQQILGTVEPGGSKDVFFRARASASEGTHFATVTVETEEVGSVSARVELIVEPVGLPVSEQFIADDTVNSQVDVLFVIDDSGSMGDDQQILANNFDRFIESAFLNTTSVDVRIGVTTTDILNQGSANGTLVGFPAVMRSGTPTLAAEFRSRALVGTEGSGLELGLEAMARALDGRNIGFPRPAAALSVIIVSDEDDGGPFAQDPGLNRSPSSYIQTLTALKAGSFSGAPVLVNLVVFPNFSPRYREVADAFDGVILDISSEDWGNNLGEIGAATVGLSRLLRLQNSPLTDSVTVTIDGVETTAFSVDASGQAVLLDEDPPPGAEIIIAYEIQC